MPAATDRATRHFALLMPNEPLCCPRGHRVKIKMWLLGGDALGAFRCTFRESPHSDECNAGVFVLGVEAAPRLLVHVSIHELHELENARMTIKEIRDHLGLRWAA